MSAVDIVAYIVVALPIDVFDAIDTEIQRGWICAKPLPGPSSSNSITLGAREKSDLFVFYI